MSASCFPPLFLFMSLHSPLKYSVVLAVALCLAPVTRATIFTYSTSTTGTSADPMAFDLGFAEQTISLPSSDFFLFTGLTSANVGQTFSLSSGAIFNTFASMVTDGVLGGFVFQVLSSGGTGTYAGRSEATVLWDAPSFPYQPAADGSIDLAGYTLNSISLTIDNVTMSPFPSDPRRTSVKFETTLTLDATPHSVPDSTPSILLFGGTWLTLVAFNRRRKQLA